MSFTKNLNEGFILNLSIVLRFLKVGSNPFSRYVLFDVINEGHGRDGNR